jgi:Cyclin, N-terminal domain
MGQDSDFSSLINRDFEILSLRQHSPIRFDYLLPKPLPNQIALKHRRELLQWIKRLSTRFYGNLEAYFHSGMLVDSVCTKIFVKLCQYQCLGAACFMISSKNIHFDVPSVKELSSLSSGGFTTEDLIVMERIVLNTVSWKIQFSTPYTFLEAFLEAICSPDNHPDIPLVKEIALDALVAIQNGITGLT